MAFVSKFKAANAGAVNQPTGTKLQTDYLEHTYVKPQPQHQSTAHQKGRPMGGWDDDDNEPTLRNNNRPAVYKSDNINPTNTVKSPLSINTDNKFAEKPTKVVQPSQYEESYKKFEALKWNDDFNEKHEYEVKVINDLIQPGGARLRQPDIALNEFCKAAESLQIEVVGSILLHSLVSQIVWISKARAIFAIETLIKKIPKYYEFFKRNIRHLRRNEFENEGANATQLTKYIDEVINHLEDPEKAPQHLAQSATILPKKNGSQTTKTYSQSAVQPTEGTLSAQLESNPDLLSHDIETVPETPSGISSPDVKPQNIQDNSPEKAENIMNSLAGLNFSDEPQPKKVVVDEEQEKKNELYNLYNASLPNPMHNIGGPMPYNTMPGPHGMNPYGPGPHGYPNHNGYPNGQFYRPQVNPHYPQYNNPNMYSQAGNGYSKPMGYPAYNYQNQYNNQYNNGQYNLQGQQMNVDSGESYVESVIKAEELKKKKQQEEREKRFDNLNVNF